MHFHTRQWSIHTLSIDWVPSTTPHHKHPPSSIIITLDSPSKEHPPDTHIKYQHLPKNPPYVYKHMKYQSMLHIDSALQGIFLNLEAKNNYYYHDNDNRILTPHITAEESLTGGWWYKPEYIFNELHIYSAMTTKRSTWQVASCV